MSDATFITTIVSMSVAFLGAMGVIAHVLGARIGDLRGDLQTSIAGIRDEMHLGFAGVSARFDDVNARFDDVNARLDAQSTRIARIEERLDGIAQTVAEHEGRLK